MEDVLLVDTSDEGDKDDEVTLTVVEPIVVPWEDCMVNLRVSGVV